MISKRLLIDTIEVISNEDDGNGGNDVSITIENVRFSKEINLSYNTYKILRTDRELPK